MKNISLNGKWNLYYYDATTETALCPSELINKKKICATVPGNAELDLSASGELPKDLYFGMNIKETEKFETYDFWYELEFEAEETDKKAHLLFEGVDCLAEYWLGDEKIGESDNALVPVEIDVTGKLQKKNTLFIKLSSVLLAGLNEQNKAINIMPLFYKRIDSLRIRKAPHAYGWDIMPRAVSAGLWRNVSLIYEDEARIIQHGYAVTDLSEEKADLRFYVEAKLPVKKLLDGCEIEISGKCEDSEFKKIMPLYSVCMFSEIVIENPRLWWPRGYGKANLYEVTYKILHKGNVLTQLTEKIGIRTAELINSEITDGKNGNFEFVINGTPVFALGTNWVPMDAFHSRDRERMPEALRLTYDIGCNIVRCWGGNVYEDDLFYEFCDEHGIMVWQDFSMACHLYPQDEEFLKKIENEAEIIVKRLRNHPSIILWSGDNECDQNMLVAMRNPNDNLVTRKAVKSAVLNNDFLRPYLPSSPYFSDAVYKMKENIVSAEDHIWGPRDYYKSSFYTESKCHFISECGYFGCPSKESLKKYISDDKLWPCDNSEWYLHSSDQYDSSYRIDNLKKQVKQLFGEVPEDMNDFILASQISQAEAMKFFIERMRCGRPVKTGIIWWNLVDGWPQISDAAVDYYYDKKLAYGYVKKAQQPLNIMMSEICNWNQEIVADNISCDKYKGHVTVTDITSGKKVFDRDFEIGANTNKVLGKFEVMYSKQTFFNIEWTIDGEKFQNHYTAGTPPFSLERYKEFLNEIGVL